MTWSDEDFEKENRRREKVKKQEKDLAAGINWLHRLRTNDTPEGDMALAILRAMGKLPL